MDFEISDLGHLWVSSPSAGLVTWQRSAQGQVGLLEARLAGNVTGGGDKDLGLGKGSLL